MSAIKKVFAREILDSRGNPTVEVESPLALPPANMRRWSCGITIKAAIWAKGF